MIDNTTAKLETCLSFINYRTSAIISRCLYFFTPFLTAVYNVEQLILQTIYVLNKEFLKLLGLKIAVYNQERVIMACIQYVSFFNFKLFTRFILSIYARSRI